MDDNLAAFVEPRAGRQEQSCTELFSCLTIGSQSYTLLSHTTGDI